jgi:hypothetical protein
MNTRSALGFAAVCGVLTAAFAFARSSAPLAAFCAVSGATALCLAPLLGSLGTLRVQSRGVYAAVVGFGLATGLLSVLGRVLKNTTHHRPLGAVTFAFLSLFVVLGALALSFRVSFASRPPRALGRVLAGVAFLSVLALLIPLIRSPSTRAGVADVALALGSGAVFSLVPWPERVRARVERVGPWLWAALVMLGLVSSHGAAGAAAVTASPALTAIFTWF